MKNPLSKDARQRRHRARVRKQLKRLRKINRTRKHKASAAGKVANPFAGAHLTPKQKEKFDRLRWEHYSWLSFGDDVSGIEFTPNKQTALNRISDAAIGIDPDMRNESVAKADEVLRQKPYEPRILVTFAEDGTILFNGSKEHPVYGSPENRKNMSAMDILNAEKKDNGSN